MSEELTVMPEPTGKEPDYAQSAMIEVRQQQLLECQKIKQIGLNVIKESLQFAADVQSGKEQLYDYLQDGTPIPINGRKYVFEKGLAVKAYVAAMETIEGKESANVDQLAAAILSRSKGKPKKVVEGEIIESEIIG